MKSSTRLSTAAAVAMVCLISGGLAKLSHAAAILNQSADVDTNSTIGPPIWEPFELSSTDLVNEGQSTLDSVTGWNGNATYPNQLNNGTYEGPFVDHGVYPENGEITTFNLDVSTNTFGYDISQIQMAVGSKYLGSQLNFNLSVSQAGNAGFTQILASGQQGLLTGPSLGRVRQYTVVNDTGGAFATNVDAIQIEWLARTSKVWEFDVTGVPTSPVPEPSSFLLAALGLMGLGWFGVRRRRG